MTTDTMNLISKTLGGRFKVLDLLSGGMGILFVVEDLALQRKGVIKTISQDDKGLRRRFIEELKAISLIRSQFVVETYEIMTGMSLFELPDENEYVRLGQYSKTTKLLSDYYLYMEYCNGGDLRAKLNFTPRIQLEEGLIYAMQFVSGMLECQKSFPGLVHRDIKPENILFNDGVLKISDFGLIRQAPLDDFFERHNKNINNDITIKDLKTNFGNLIGTIPYMSPEQIRGNIELDIRSDIFSYGVVLYEMFVGKRPYTGDFVELRQRLLSKDDMPSIADARPDLDRRISQVIDRCLKKNPLEIPSSCSEVIKIWLEFVQPTMAENQSQSHTSGTKILLPNNYLFMDLDRHDPMYVEEGERNGHVFVRINQKPLNSLRKAKELFYLDKNEDALEVIDDALELHSRTDKLAMQNHLVHLLMNKEEKMIQIPDESGRGDIRYQINIGPLVEVFMDLRGKCYAGLVDVITQGGKQADESTKKAAMVNAELITSLFPSNAEMFILAAQTYMCLNDFETALQSVEAAKNLEPNSERVTQVANEIWTRKGMYHVQSGDFQEGISCYDKLIVIDPSDARAWFNKGIVLAQGGDVEEALATLKQADKLGHPGAGQVIAALLSGKTLVTRRTTEPTEENIERAIQAFVRANSSNDMIKAVEIYPFMMDIDFLKLLKSLIEESSDDIKVGLINRFEDLISIVKGNGMS